MIKEDAKQAVGEFKCPRVIALVQEKAKLADYKTKAPVEDEEQFDQWGPGL